MTYPKKGIISASILSADFAHLADEVKRAADAGVDHIHCDVMDHHFVPNLSFGPVICEALRRCTSLPIDVHLMVNDPESLIRPFADAGANLLTFHAETVHDVFETVAKIRQSGMKAGLAFNPERPIEIAPELFSEIELILVMSVNPGFGGQAFIEDSVEKIRYVRDRLDQLRSPVFLGVDGGIKVETVTPVVQAGANFIVIGSGLFHAADYHRVIADIRRQMEQSHAADAR